MTIQYIDRLSIIADSYNLSCRGGVEMVKKVLAVLMIVSVVASAAACIKFKLLDERR